MELGESTKEGAAREVWEEACAKAEIGPLLAVYYVPGQVMTVNFSHSLSESCYVPPFSQLSTTY